MADREAESLPGDVQAASAILQSLAETSALIPKLESHSTNGKQESAHEPPAQTLPRSIGEHEWSNDLLWSLLESLPDAFVVIDCRGQVLLCNSQTEALFGYTRDELLGQPIELLVAEHARELHIRHRAKYLENPHPRSMGRGLDLYGRRKDGEDVPVEISLSPLQTDGGLLVCATIRDISERKKEKARFRDLVEQIPAVTFMAPLDGDITQLYVSPQIERLLGFSQEEWLSNPVLWFEQLHPDDRERWNDQFAPTCAQGQAFREIYRFISKDGQVVWVQGTANIVRDEHGHPLFLQGLAFDISPVKEAELVQRQLAAIVESSADAIIGKTLAGTITSWNKGAQRIYGYTQKEAIGQSIEMLVPADRPDEIPNILKRIRRGESIDHYDTVRVRKDGRKIDVSLTISAIRDAKGTVVGASAIARDVTRRNKAQRSLFAQARANALEAAVSTTLTRITALAPMLQECTEALLQHLNAVVSRIWTLANDGNVLVLRASAGSCTHLNDADRRVPVGRSQIGVIAEEMKPYHSTDARNDPLLRDLEWTRCEGAIAFAGYPLIVENRLVGVMAIMARQPLANEMLRALELTAAHISLGIERKRIEEDLERRVEERTRELEQSFVALSEKTEELEQFAQVASHDFKEPLRSLVNYPQKLAKDYREQLDERALQWLERTIAGGQRMRRLIEDVRQYSRVIRHSRSFESVDCNAICESALANLQAAIDERQAQITYGRLPAVYGQQSELILLFQNLIGNALKFHSPERSPTVQVGARRQDNDWLIWLRDNGIGIEAKFLERIFTLGERLHSASKYPGTGFGLAICEKIIRRHGGRIWAESELNVGSTFYFTLPENPITVSPPIHTIST